jgi:hypothetical protein
MQISDKVGDKDVPKECNSKFGGFSSKESDMMKFMRLNLVNNFQFMLMSAHFSDHVFNREGFAKLYQNMADQAWNDAIELIKYTTKRGASVVFNTTAQEFDMTEKVHDLKLKNTFGGRIVIFVLFSDFGSVRL